MADSGLDWIKKRREARASTSAGTSSADWITSRRNSISGSRDEETGSGIDWINRRRGKTAPPSQTGTTGETTLTTVGAGYSRLHKDPEQAVKGSATVVLPKETATADWVADRTEKASLPAGYYPQPDPIATKARAKQEAIYGSTDVSGFTYQTTAEYDTKIKELEEKQKKVGWTENGGIDVFAIFSPKYHEKLKGYQQEIDELKAERTLLERATYMDKTYGNLKNNPDFEEKTQQITTNFLDDQKITNAVFEPGLGVPQVAGNPFLKSFEQGNAPAEQKLEMGTAKKPNAVFLESLVDGGEYITDEEWLNYTYLQKAQGKEAARQYLDDLKIILQKRLTTAEAWDTAEEYDKASAAGKVFMNAGTLITSPVGNVVAGVNDITEAVTGQYSPYGSAHSLQNYTDTVRGETAENIYTGVRNAGGSDGVAQLTSTLYQGGMSGLDSVVGGLALGKGYLAVAAAGSATRKAKELYESGADGWQIAAGSVASGVIEAAMEKVPLDELGKMAGGTKGFRGMVRNVIRQAGIEGTEEALTEIANMTVDSMIQGGNSDLSREIATYQKQGYTAEQARQMAARDKALDVLWATVGGMAGGAGSATVMSTVGLAKDYQQATNVGKTVLQQQGGLEQAVSLGLSNVPYSDAYKTAQRIKASMQNSKSTGVSTYQVGKMILESQSEEAVAARKQYQTTIDSAKAVGVSEEIATTAATAAARFNRQIEFVSPDQLRVGGTDGQFAFIGKMKDGTRVYDSDMDPSLTAEQRKEEFRNRIATIFNLGAVELKTDTKKILVRGDKFTAKKNIYGDEYTTRNELDAKYRMLYEMADVLNTATYLPGKTAQEPSYTNPGIKPKNAAHKDVKYWYKFQNDIVMDGVGYTVTFNIRDKGKEQYQYLIDVKENGYTVNHTALQSLRQAYRVSTNTTVSQNSFGVNTHSMQEGAEYTPSSTAMGRYTADGRILLSSDISTEEALSRILKHELAHSIEGTAAWDTILKAARRQTGATAWSQMVSDTATQRQELGDTVGAATPEREAVADWIGKNLYSENFAQVLAKNDRQAAGKFVQVLDKLRLALAGSGNRGAATRIAALERVYMRALESEQTTGEGQYAVAPNDNDFLKFYNDVMSMQDRNKRSKRRYRIGDVSTQQASIINTIFQSQLGKSIDLAGYELWIDGSGVEHIEHRHGSHGVADQSMADVNDLAKIPWVANNAQNGELLYEINGQPKRDYAYRNSDGSPSYQVRLFHQIANDTYCVVECVPDSEKKRLYIKTAYKKSGNGQLLNLNPNGNRQLTSKTGVGGITTNTTVSQNSFGVNTHSMQNVPENVQNVPENVQNVPKIPDDSRSFLPPELAEANERARQARIARQQAVRVEADTLHRNAVERAVSGQRSTPPSQAQTMEELRQELGDEELHRRLYLADQIDRPEGTIEVDGRTMDVQDYIRAVEDLLPNDAASLEQFIDEAKRRSVQETRQAYEDGNLEHSTRLPINLQLFAAKCKLDWANISQSEGGKETRQFYEKRLQGMDENHHQELVDMLAGRSETYNPIANEKTLNQAKDKLRNSEWKDKLEQRLYEYHSGRTMFSAMEGAAIQVMINDAMNDGDYEKAAGMIQMYSRCGTDLGRAVQIMSLQRKLTPEGTIKAATREFRKAADEVMGKHTNESLDILAGDVTDAIGRLKGSRVVGSQADTAAYADGTAPAPQGGKGAAKPLTNEELEDALVKNIRQNNDPYVSEEEVRGILHRAIENASDMPAHLKKMLQKDETIADLAQRIAKVEANGHLNDATMRHAFEEALGLPTLSGEEVGQLTELVNRMNSLEEGTLEHQEAMEDIYRFVGSRLPVSGLETWQAWRKLAMLGNPKTHIRNFTSNVAMYGGVHQADNALATLMERVFIKDPAKRTTMLGWSRTEHGQKISPAVDKAAERALVQMRRGGGKYDISESRLSGYKKYFGKSKVGEALNKASDFNSAWLEKGDALTFVPAFKQALGQIMTVRGMTEVTDEVYQMAYDRATEVTFRAENALAKWLNSIKRKGGAVGTIADIAIPFTKTPANIAVQMVEHSPIGVVKGAFDLVQSARGAKNAKGATEAINEISKGITGSALMAIGLLLGSLGLFNTKYGKTEKERAADELAGVQENALILPGGWSVTLDWLQPAASPLVIGASIGQRLQEDGLEAGTIFGAVMDGTDSLFELTMLQSLYDILGGYDAGVSSSLASVAENAVSQSVPTLLGQAARSIDPVQRRPSGEGPVDGEFGKYLNQVLAKVPGLTYLLEPELDVWGDEVYRTGKADTAGGWLNFLQQLILPANVKRATAEDDITLMLLDLYENAEEKGSYAIPSAPSRDDATEMDLLYADMARQVGGAQRLAVEDLVSGRQRYTVQQTLPNGKKRNVTKRWSQMTDEERLRVLNRIYGDVKENQKEPEDDYYVKLLEEALK